VLMPIRSILNSDLSIFKELNNNDIMWTVGN
jgi:hypothetical protein